MPTKIIRTIFGLPFVLIAWTFATTIMCLVLAIMHFCCFCDWAFTGNYLPSNDTADDYGKITRAFTRILSLPYQFIKRVWK